MTRCNECGTWQNAATRCNSCKEKYCSEHQHPNNHNCKSVQKEKIEYSVEEVTSEGHWTYSYYTLLLQIALIPLVMAAFAISIIGGSIGGAKITFPILVFIVWGWWLVTMFLSLPGMIGLWKDAKLLEKSDSAWKPNRYMYLIFALLTAGFLACPIYGLNRLRNIGVPEQSVVNRIISFH